MTSHRLLTLVPEGDTHAKDGWTAHVEQKAGQHLPRTDGRQDVAVKVCQPMQLKSS